MGNPAPCKYCTDRTLGCHGVCVAYNNWVVEHTKERVETRHAMPPYITPRSFTGTSPKPGKARKGKDKFYT